MKKVLVRLCYVYISINDHILQYSTNHQYHKWLESLHMYISNIKLNIWLKINDHQKIHEIGCDGLR